MKTWLLARFTLREAVRKKAVLGGIILTVAFLLLYTIGLYFAYSNMRVPAQLKRSVDSELLLAGLYFVEFIAGLLAIFSSVGTISSEIEQGTLHAIVPKPLRRWEVVAGKWLGFAIMLTAYIVITTVFVVATVYVQSGYFPAQPWQGLVVMILGPLLLLSLSMLGTCSFSTVTTGIIVFMLYALALAGGRLEQLGRLIQDQTLVNIGIVTSLVVPSDALWRKASNLMGAGGFLTPGGVTSPFLFSVTEPPSIWMVSYAAIYTIVALLGAIMVFQKKDL